MNPGITTRNAKRSTGPPVLEAGDDWDKFRRLFEAYGERNGLQPALERADHVINKRKMKVRLGPPAKEDEEEGEEEEKEQQVAIEEQVRKSNRLLCADLVEAIQNQGGVPYEIVARAHDGDRDGVRAWIELIEYFEYTQRHLRLREYRTRYEQLTLEETDGPEALYLEMKRLQRQMEYLGETISEETSTDKFLQAVEESYKEEVRIYEATMFSGAKMSTENLMEMMRRSEKTKRKKEINETALRCECCHKTNCCVLHTAVCILYSVGFTKPNLHL